MKRTTRHSALVLFLLPCLTFAQGVKELTLSGNPTAGEYKARDKVSVVPVAGTGTTIVAGSRLFCDPGIQVPVDYSANAGAGFSSQPATIDLSLPVGSIQGYASNNLYGGANYTLPFSFPKSTGGIAPEGFALSYNSNNTMRDIAGMGWGLSGLHAVSRQIRNFHDDGFAGGIALCNNDRFNFDGSILLPSTSSVNGFDGTEYHAEQESFAKIISHSATTTDGPDWFEVLTKEGTTLEIGKTNDAKLYFSKYDQGVEHKIYVQWMVNKITDKRGNTITFEYETKNNTELEIKKVKYASNPSAGINNPEYEINFLYELSSFPANYFIGPKQVNNTVLLRKIQTLFNGNLINTYDFTYNKTHVFELLVSVQQKNDKGEKLNPTVFNYDVNFTEGTASTIAIKSANGATSTVFPMDNKQYFFVDYNADGLKDMIRVQGVDAPSQTLNHWWLYKNNGDGTFTFIDDNSTNDGTIFTYFEYAFSKWGSLNKGYQQLGTEIVDFNGDGYEDFALISEYTYKTQSLINPLQQIEKKSIKIQRFISTGGTYTALNEINRTNDDISANFVTHITDMDGDAKDELVFLDDNSNEVSLFFGNNTIVTSAITGEISALHTFPLDQDGSGKSSVTNIVKVDIGSAQPFSFHTISYANGSIIFDAGFPEANFFINTDCSSPTNERAFIGDYNGDGSLDNLICTSTSGNLAWTLRYGNSFGYTTKNVSSTFNTPFACNNHFFIRDVNNDGKSDVIVFSAGNPDNVNVWYSNGNDFYNDNSFELSGFGDYRMDFADIDGDGISDLLMIPPVSLFATTGEIFVHYFKKSATNCLLSNVTDGMGKFTRFNYALSTKSNYSVAARHSYPYQTMFQAQKLLTGIDESDGISGFFNTAFSYAEGIYNLQGRGFIGFMKTTVDDEAENTRISTESILSAGHAVLLDSKTEIRSLASGNPLVRTITENNFCDNIFSANGNNSYIINNTWITDKDELSGAITRTDNTINANDDGNLTYQKITYNGNVETEETTIAYDNSVKSTVPYLPNSITKKVTRNGGANERLTTIAYYSGTHLPQTVIADPDRTSNTVTTVLEYWAPGNLKKQSISGAGVAAIKETSYNYDANFKSLVKISNKVNSVNQITQIAYHPVLNVPVSITDIAGLSTQLTYDGWLRPLSRKLPNGITQTIAYNWVQPGEITQSGHKTNISPAVFKISTELPGSPSAIAYYDLLGRNILSASDGFSEKQFNGAEYDTKGLLVKTAGPYQTGSTMGYKAVYTNYAYDDFNRIKQLTLNDDQEAAIHTTYDYSYPNNGIKIAVASVDDNNKTNSYTLDAAGRLVSVTDPNGTQMNYVYTYTTATNTSAIDVNIAGSRTVTAEFNEVGHQTVLNDIYAHSTNYTYDAFGHLLTETDPNGNTYTYAGYDELDRYSKKTGPDGTYNYSYVAGANGINQPDNVIGPGNITYDYSYDNLQRLTGISEDHNGTVFNTAVQYDIFGNPKKITYPDANGFAINQTYTSKGYLQEITDAGTNKLIWHASESNPLNQVTQTVTGNNKTNNYTFNNYGFLQNMQTSGGISNRDYNFNLKNGNLSDLSDYVKSYTENFAYTDNLDRLNNYSHTLPGNPGINVSYNAQGQILSKDDAGTLYHYDANSHAVQTIDNATAEALGQLTDQALTYTAFNKTQTITQNGFELNYTYGPDQQRAKGEWKYNGQLYRTRRYATNYEHTTETINGTTSTFGVSYVYAPTGLCALHVNENGTAKNYFVTGDHLGSINTLTDENGAVVAEQNFDAWGRMRNPDDLNYLDAPTTPTAQGWLYRGFTGHEMLPEFGLINMNARLYDPVLGVMLRPDNEVGDPLNAQNFQRLAYVLNNPLKYTDPTGNSADIPLRTVEITASRNSSSDPLSGGGGSFGAMWGAQMSMMSMMDDGGKGNKNNRKNVQKKKYDVGKKPINKKAGLTPPSITINNTDPDRAVNYPDDIDWRYRPETAVVMYTGALIEDIAFDWTHVLSKSIRTFNSGASSKEKFNAILNANFALMFGLPGKNNRNFTKLKGNQGWKDPNGNIWKKDMLHKDHFDISDPKNNKIQEIDFNGKQLWPNGPKNTKKK